MGRVCLEAIKWLSAAIYKPLFHAVGESNRHAVGDYWQYRIHQHNRDHYTKRCLLYEREELSFFNVQHIYGVIVFDLRLTQLYSSADTMQALGRYYRIGCCPPTNKDTIMPQEINSLFASALSSSQDCN